jgi:hypothetical protein
MSSAGPLPLDSSTVTGPKRLPEKRIPFESSRVDALSSELILDFSLNISALPNSDLPKGCQWALYHVKYLFEMDNLPVLPGDTERMVAQCR